jgi:dTDP-4-dehydrorhamnose 3,5-epimerase
MHKGATKDVATVTQAGESLSPLLHGITFRPVVTHLDSRGSVCELFDPRWKWHPDPLIYVHMFTVRPGNVKGWGLHKLHEDRYFVLYGEMEVVMYDVRPDSPTQGKVATVVLSEFDRRLMNIPANVWHANHNIGSKDVCVISFPTRPYQHEDPDKYRLPLDTDEIPHKFRSVAGW